MIEYAGSLFKSKRDANRAAVEDFFRYSVMFPEGLENWTGENTADELLECWELPYMNGHTRQSVVELIDEVLEQMREEMNNELIKTMDYV